MLDGRFGYQGRLASAAICLQLGEQRKSLEHARNDVDDPERTSHNACAAGSGAICRVRPRNDRWGATSFRNRVSFSTRASTRMARKGGFAFSSTRFCSGKKQVNHQCPGVLELRPFISAHHQVDH